MPRSELLVEHRNLAADLPDLADQYLQGGACIGWQGISVGKRLPGELREVGNAGVCDEAQFSQVCAQGIGKHSALRTSRARAR